MLNNNPQYTVLLGKLLLLQCFWRPPYCGSLRSAWWQSGLVGNIVGCINNVNRRWVHLVLGRLTVSVCNQPPRSTQPGQSFMGRHIEYQRKLGHKQAHCAMH